jgi:predicted NUDIX family NTP pyrophosphohydrolase
MIGWKYWVPWGATGARMAQHSAGILLYRRRSGRIEVLLTHPGGPFWRNRDEGAWMIPKGMVEPGEVAAEAALREFEEETGTRLTSNPFPLATVRQAGGKMVEAFALEGDLDPATIRSIEFEVEWPPRSGRRQSYPEVEEARWMGLAEARALMLPSQLPLLDALESKLGG